jgi:hypothetical protein
MVFGKLHSNLIDINIKVDTGSLFEHAAEIGFAAMAEFGDLSYADLVADILPYVIDGVEIMLSSLES